MFNLFFMTSSEAPFEGECEDVRDILGRRLGLDSFYAHLYVFMLCDSF